MVATRHKLNLKVLGILVLLSQLLEIARILAVQVFILRRHALAVLAGLLPLNPATHLASLSGQAPMELTPSRLHL
jgi:hypothetical protein